MVIISLFFFFKMGQSQSLFAYFRLFLVTISIIHIAKSVDGVLGIQTRGCRMGGADKTTEFLNRVCHLQLSVKNVQ